MRRLGLGLTLTAHGRGGETAVFMDIQRAGLVLGIKGVVLALEVPGVTPTQRQGELAPAVVGVKGNQGVVQVKQGQLGLLIGFPSWI
jgi:hypothetical protein